MCIEIDSEVKMERKGLNMAGIRNGTERTEDKNKNKQQKRICGNSLDW